MNLAGLFQGASTWINSVRAAVSGDASGVPDHRASSVAALALRNATAAGELDRYPVRKGTDALRAALSDLSTRSKSVLTSPGRHNGWFVKVRGVVPRLAPVDESVSTLRATVAVNTQTTTERSSYAPIGLDRSALADAPSVLRSSSGLGLDVTSEEARSTVTSTGELSSRSSSYDPCVLRFGGDGVMSGAVGTLTGAYAGVGAAAAATSLTFEMDATSNLNVLVPVRVRFRLSDQAGAELFSFDGNLRPGDGVYLGDDIGLTLWFSSGTLLDRHTSWTYVSHRAEPVDGDGAFSSRTTKLHFANGVEVRTGSFSVNGSPIPVSANDTLNTVLARISASGAGVVAALANDRVTLSTVANSDQDIVLAADTSGFLAMTRLVDARTARGVVRDDRRAVAQGRLGRIGSGVFVVNGATISVNRDTDTLASVLNAISASGAGVTASFDSASSRVVLTARKDGDEVITVGDDTSGFLAAVKLSSTNTVRGRASGDTAPRLHPSQELLAAIPAFADVTAGTFTVNGAAIPVHPEEDTLESVLARVTTTDIGVMASYDPETDVVTLLPAVTGSTLAIEADSSGLLAAVKVAPGVAGTRFNPDAAFNAHGLDAPLLDPGFEIGAGHFTVNGAVIDVAAADTATTVLDRITGSSAGVIATYDAMTQKVNLVSRAGTSPIALGADTSGFLDAVKLDATALAGVELRTCSAFNANLETMPEYSAVQAGTITVNGETIRVHPARTTITDVIAAVNAVADVSATVEEHTGAIVILSRHRGGSIALSDTSGLVSTLGIAAAQASGDAPAAAAPAAVAVPAAAAPVADAAAVAASQKLAAEQAQGSLFFLARMRPRAPEAAARIRSTPIESRRKPSAATPGSGSDDPAPAATADGPTTPRSIIVSATPEVLRPLLDLFADVVATRDGYPRRSAATWWRR